MKKELYYAGVSEILIERTARKVRVTVVAARPGIIIGKTGADVEKLKESLKKIVNKDIFLNINEVKKLQRNAQLCADSVATQLARAATFCRVM